VNRRLLPWMVGSVTVALCSASFVSACDKGASAHASAKVASATKDACTPAQMAACKSKHGATATTASADHCAGKSAKATNAAFASAGASCATKGASMTHAMAAKGSAFAMPAGAGCATKGAATMAHNPAQGCDACADMALCEGELKAVGSQYQTVPLKNGVMFVYSAVNARGVRAVQTAIARRTERMNALVSAEKATLCGDCKAMRGALASGKLNREIVNVEGGSISLVTSDDPSIVAKLYAMAGVN
jgi:hypothetical protein